MPLSKLQFFASLSLLALCLIAANSAVAFLTRHSLPRMLLRHISTSPRSTASLVVLGNSLLVAGFDVSQFNAEGSLGGRREEAINLALGATNPVEHLLFLRDAAAHGIRPRLVIYGFFDLQLTDLIKMSNTEILGNHDVLYYLEPEYARTFLHLSSRAAVEFEVMRRWEMLADRSIIWARIEVLRRNLAAQGMPPVEENRFGRVKDFSLLESHDAAAFASQVDAAASVPLTPAVQEILRQASQFGARVVFVEMPMPSRHRHLFYDTDSWLRYRSHLRSLASSHGAAYLDASHWITDDSLFSDHIHLNTAGATVFTRKLAAAIRQEDLLRASETPASASSIGNLP